MIHKALLLLLRRVGKIPGSDEAPAPGSPQTAGQGALRAEATGAGSLLPRLRPPKAESLVWNAASPSCLGRR